MRHVADLSSQPEAWRMRMAGCHHVPSIPHPPTSHPLLSGDRFLFAFRRPAAPENLNSEGAFKSEKYVRPFLREKDKFMNK